MQPECIKSDRVLGIVVPPSVEGNVLQRLERIVVSIGEAVIDHPSRRSCGIADAEVGRLEDRAHYAFSRHRMSADKVPVARQHAAKVLRPGAVHIAVYDYVPKLSCAQLLRLRWSTQERVSFPVDKELHWSNGRT